MGWENCWVDFEKKIQKSCHQWRVVVLLQVILMLVVFFSFLNLEKICFDNDYYFFFGHMVPNEIKENLVGW